MRNKKLLLGVLLLLAIGFATVTTTLIMTGNVKIATNDRDFDVKFTKAILDGTDISSTVISGDGKSITFGTNNLTTVGDISKLDFEVTNNSELYDAEVSIDCSATGEKSSYYSIYKEVADTIVAKRTGTGKVEVTLTKASVEDIHEEFTCTLSATAKERTTKAEKAYLYKILQDAAEEGTYAKEYTGAHQDSMNASGTQKIYHWYAENDTDGTAILDKNNVIFAGQCWQMIRTTDTGGVKMIYNGEAVDNKCLLTRGTHVGYGGYRTSQNLASNYWYGTDYTYDSTAKIFKLSGTTEQVTWNATTGPGLVGKYTCKSTSVDGSCETLYLIESYKDTANAYVIRLNSNSHYSQFGILDFNARNNSSSYDSPSYVGYMYNTRYPHKSKTMSSREEMFHSSFLKTSYWYAGNAKWGDPTANKWNLVSPYQVLSTSDYSSLVGKYTFGSSSETYTSSTVKYIAAVDNSTYYYISLQSGQGLDYYNDSYTYGDSYTDNGDGTYTINSPTTIKRADWFTNYSKMKNKYVCKNAVDNKCSDLWYVTSTSASTMDYIKVADSYKYAKGFDWDGSKYILNDNSVTFWNISDSTNKTSINNHHYTCWNTIGECPTLSYIYYIDGDTPYYIDLTNNKSVEDALNEMLHNDNVNTINSTIKSGVDAWYKHYMLDYDDYIEDTIFCNDRSIDDLGGWNPNGGSTTEGLHFKQYNITTDLSCTNRTDQFSISNNRAKLTYKVGLMSSPEMNLLKNSIVRKTGQKYWLGSPYRFNHSTNSFERFVYSDGDLYSGVVVFEYGVRPAVSLTPGIEYSDGDGSMENPYKVN